MSTADRIPGASPIGKSPVKQIAKAIIQVRPDYAELLNATDIDSEAILGKSRSSFDIQFVTDIYSLSGHLDHRTKSSAKSFTNLLTERKEIAHVICDKFRDILEAFVDQAEADAKIAADLIAKRGVK